MISRRKAIQAAALTLAAGPLLAQAKRSEVLTQDLPAIDGSSMKITVVELQYEPGGSSPQHRHPGPTFVYVLEGSLLAQVEGRPLTTYTAGQMFYEPPGGIHMVSKNASDTRPVKFLAFLISEKGKPLTVPVSGT